MDKVFQKKLEKYLDGCPNIDKQTRAKMFRDILSIASGQDILTNESKVIIEGITLNREEYELYIDGKKIVKKDKKGNIVSGISKKEFELLDLLMRNPNMMYSRQMILDRIWGESVVNDRTVDVHICKIKEKLGKKYEDKIISRKGVGYKFQA